MQRKFGFLAFLMVVVFLFSGNVLATPMIDGIFEFAEWDGYYADDDGVGSNGYVNPGWGGQAYDVEYLGLYITNDKVYFGLQTGFDVSSTVQEYPPGDFALDVNGDGDYEYAIDFSISGTSANYTLVDMATSGASWADVAYYSDANPWQADYSNPLATFAGAFGSGNLANNSDGGMSYVLEGSFDRELLELYTGRPMTLHWTMQCGNDYLNQTSAPVPEPATMLLLGTGLIGLAGFGRKKFLKKT